jgi:hypothetical protein
MPPNDESEKIRTALNESLKMLGEYARLATWRELETQFQISLAGNRKLTRAEVAFALQKLFGRGSEAILKSFELELHKLQNGTS